MAGVAAGLPDVRTETAEGSSSWSSAGVVFAVLGADGAAELRLEPAIVAAALRTPDATPSERGPAWVRFKPPALDGPAVDRLTAWFAAAHRRAKG
jgi:hypothetical protein